MSGASRIGICSALLISASVAGCLLPGFEVGGQGASAGSRLTGVQQLAASVSHICALLEVGTVWCWGDSHGLGDMEDRGDDEGEGPGQVDLGQGQRATQLVTGDGHSCAILESSEIKCWGRNDSGQLGLEDVETRGDEAGEMGDQLPTVVLGGRRISQLALGSSHTCALDDEGQVLCWGDNSSGQLGLGNTIHRGHTPESMDPSATVDLGLGRFATAIAAGQDHSCVVLDDSSIKCWGDNDYGQLGVGDDRDRGAQPGDMGDSLPPVDLGDDWASVAVTCADQHTCALSNDGRLKCWGPNSQGQLGLGDNVSRGTSPDDMGNLLPVLDLGAALQISAGSYHTCALLADSTVKCWGVNASGVLGIGSREDRGAHALQMGDRLPAVHLVAPALAVEAGLRVTCAILQDRRVSCWGSNNEGMLALGGRGGNWGELPTEEPVPIAFNY